MSGLDPGHHAVTVRVDVVRPIAVVLLQMLIAVGGGAWAGFASTMQNPWLAALAAIGVSAGLAAAWALSGAFALVVAPTLLAHADSLRHGGHDPFAAAPRSRPDYVGGALLLGAMAMVSAASLACALVVWLLGAEAVLLDTLLRFAAVGLLLAVLMPAVRRTRV